MIKNIFMRKRKVLFLGRPYAMAASVCLLLSTLASISLATWQLTVDGPNEARAGELVVLSAGYEVMSLEPGEKATPNFIWQVLPPDSATNCFRVCDDGRTLVFASRQIGCFHFVLAASDGETLQMVTHTLFNLGEQLQPIPLPPPDPEPEPQPQPEPSREYQALADWAAQKTTLLVTSDFFVREKTALIESLTEITTRIRHKEIPSAERARIEMRVLTRKKLDAVSRRSTAAWLTWETELARQLSQLEREGKLDSLEQVRQAFDAVVDGLVACETTVKDKPAANNGGR